MTEPTNRPADVLDTLCSCGHSLRLHSFVRGAEDERCHAEGCGCRVFVSVGSLAKVSGVARLGAPPKSAEPEEGVSDGLCYTLHANQKSRDACPDCSRNSVHSVALSPAPTALPERDEEERPYNSGEPLDEQGKEEFSEIVQWMEDEALDDRPLSVREQDILCSGISELERSLAAAESRIRELTRDKERLDYLQSRFVAADFHYAVDEGKYICTPIFEFPISVRWSNQLRPAIDAAMKEVK